MDDQLRADFDELLLQAGQGPVLDRLGCRGRGAFEADCVMGFDLRKLQKLRRSELVKEYNLGGLPDDAINWVAQKEKAGRPAAA